MRSCGAVLWNGRILGYTDANLQQAADGGTELERLAAYVRTTICWDDQVGYTNAKEESEAFLEAGGRIIERGTWEPASSEGQINQSLEDGDDRKLRFTTLQERWESEENHGPDFLFAPISSFWKDTWPILKREGHGMQPPQSAQQGASVLAEGEKPSVTSVGNALYSLFPNQEYLS